MPTTSQNISKNLDAQFNNHNYLPQKLLLEDLDGGALKYFRDVNLTIQDENDNMIPVPVIFLNQERWAEFKNDWKFLKDEGGTEITMPFMTLRRISVKPAEHPLKRATIPFNKNFMTIKVPIFDGVLKGYDMYKIPQAPRVDIAYELRFFSHYMQDANISYESVLGEIFPNKQAYMNINGYYVFMDLSDNSEDDTMDDITADRRFQIVYNIVLHGKIVDPTNFEKVPTINKIKISFKEN